MLTPQQTQKLEQILTRVGDMGFRRRVIAIINHLDIQDQDEILDCGCGEGFYTMVISELFPSVKITALDHDPVILDKAKHWLHGRKNIRFILAEWDPHQPNNLPFPSNQFDKAILSEVIEHLIDDVGAVAEIRRVLKKKGLLAITVPSAMYPFLWDPLNFTREHLGLGHFSGANQFLGGVWSWNHLRLYTPTSLSQIIKKSHLKELKLIPMVRFVLPFNYWLLFLGKKFYTSLPVPSFIADSLEKFQWQDQRSPSSLLTQILKAPLIWLDQLNTKYPGDLTTRHLSLFALVQKQ